MDEIIEINGVKYRRVEEVHQPKYKVGDWVRVVANKAERPLDGYVGKIFKITRVCNLHDYTRRDNNECVQAYSIGKIYVVYEDELELAEAPGDPFGINKGERYYYVKLFGDVDNTSFDNSNFDNACKKVANACKDEALMNQRAMHETLNRLLWRASIIAGELDNEWNMNNVHYYIYRDYDSDCLRIDCNDTWKTHGTCFFPTEDTARDALENIVIPFLKEHPDFKW